MKLAVLHVIEDGLGRDLRLSELSSKFIVFQS